MNGESQRLCCASEPATTTGTWARLLAVMAVAMPVQPQPISSSMRAPSKVPSPSPPAWVGMCTFSSPSSQALRRTSWGYSPVSSWWAATGRISSRAKSRASFWRACCCSESSKLIMDASGVGRGRGGIARRRGGVGTVPGEPGPLGGPFDELLEGGARAPLRRTQTQEPIVLEHQEVGELQVLADVAADADEPRQGEGLLRPTPAPQPQRLRLERHGDHHVPTQQGHRDERTQADEAEHERGEAIQPMALEQEGPRRRDEQQPEHHLEE